MLGLNTLNDGYIFLYNVTDDCYTPYLESKVFISSSISSPCNREKWMPFQICRSLLRFRNANSYRTNITLAHISFAELCKSFFGDICFRHYKYTPSTTAPLPHYYHHHQSSSLNIFPCLSVNSMYFNIRAAWETNTCTEAVHSLQTSRTRGREKEENSKRRRPPAGCIQETNGY